MKIFLIIIIKMYWLLIPKSKRRMCLFKKSCSKYVYEKVKSEGLISGLKALKFRINNCNSNYSIMELGNEQILITKVNNVFNRKEINKLILNKQQ